MGEEVGKEAVLRESGTPNSPCSKSQDSLGGGRWRPLRWGTHCCQPSLEPLAAPSIPPLTDPGPGQGRRKSPQFRDTAFSKHWGGGRRGVIQKSLVFIILKQRIFQIILIFLGPKVKRVGYRELSSTNQRSPRLL